MAKTPPSVNTRDPEHFQTVATMGVISCVVLRTGDSTLSTTAAGWDVGISEGTAIFLAVVYGSMTHCTFCLTIMAWSKFTGLKWDLSPIAAHISLIQGSNVAEAFRVFEYKISDDESEIFYGIRVMKWDRGEYFISTTNVDNAYNYTENELEHVNHWKENLCQNGPYRTGERPAFDRKVACSPEYARYRMTLVNLNEFWLIFFFLFDIALILACIIAIAKGCMKPSGSLATVKNQMPQKRQQFKDRPSSIIGLFFQRRAYALTELFYTIGVGILFSSFSVIWNPAETFYRRMQTVAGLSLPSQDKPMKTFC
ncbi:hypothetical protein GQ43DRAFT_472795 [Delitschia confertaspora ATCC 74209]|uniref:Uncharacterized protein n=1 Tax=Delitschia confertaspora ATCC 74209 TaxID=1513339 RepID=A0A9P4MXX9_9PLEO|nr:hypothetical protein GQ43DRAFT_472795 [Delitschia confertaspora ATCC 74209]